MKWRGRRQSKNIQYANPVTILSQNIDGLDALLRRSTDKPSEAGKEVRRAAKKIIKDMQNKREARKGRPSKERKQGAEGTKRKRSRND